MAKGGKEIRRRIKSVKNTQQITKAMKMVAAARLRKSEGRTQASRPYTDTLAGVMRNLASVATDVDHPFLKHVNPEAGRVMLLLFTGDKGLCGSFNANLVKKAESFIRDQRALGHETELVFVGKKGWTALSKGGQWFPGFNENTSYADLKPVNTVLTNAYLSGEVAEVHMIYARFINVMKSEPTAVRLLPIQSLEAVGEDEAEGFAANYDLEPSPEELLTALLPRYFQTIMFQAAMENFTSENGARMVAMENATKAAGDMIDALTLEYNKARQAGITLELLDIVGGAEALKG